MDDMVHSGKVNSTIALVSICALHDRSNHPHLISEGGHSVLESLHSLLDSQEHHLLVAGGVAGAFRLVPDPCSGSRSDRSATYQARVGIVWSWYGTAHN